MKLLLTLVTIVAVTHCSRINDVSNLISNFRYTDSEVQELIENTKALINQTKEELENLQSLVKNSAQQSAATVNNTLIKLTDYSVSRTDDLIAYLQNEIQDLLNSKSYPAQATTDCLLINNYLTEVLPNNFAARLKTSLETAVRNANATIREDYATMEATLIELDDLYNVLGECLDDGECVLAVSARAVKYNTEAIASFNDIFENVNKATQNAISAATGAANATVYLDEDYACNNADLMLSCINSFDDEVGNATTTWQPPLPTSTSQTTTTEISTTTTRSTTPLPTETTTPSTTETTTPLITETTTSEITTEITTTQIPYIYCSHEPFVPDVDI